MRIGLIQCQELKDVLTSRHGKTLDIYERAYCSADNTVSFQVWHAYKGEIPPVDAPVDAWVISGSRHSVNDGFIWIDALSEFIRTMWSRQKPMVGICFGHQLIARAMGGRVERYTGGWGLGVAANQILTKADWMFPFKKTIRIPVIHQDQVVVRPEAATRIAGNDFCQNHILQYGDCFLSIQGHPEFSSHFVKDVTEMMRPNLSQDVIDDTLRSLVLPIDGPIVIQWILTFMQNKLRAQQHTLKEVNFG